MTAEFDTYYIEPIHEKHAWRICDFVTINADRLKTYFPKTLEQNLTPTLSDIFVSKKLKDFKNQDEFLFIIKEKESPAIIGLVYIKNLNEKRKQGELAYCIGYQYEGKGITTNSVRALSKYGIDTLDLKTLQIIVHKTNVPSIRVAEKCGYTWKTTLLKEHTPPNQEPLDMELYELTA